jgi:hypothetical protein
MDRKNSIFFLLFIFFVLLSWIFTGCSSTALMTRTTVRERPDSLHLQMPPVQISAPSDFLNLERSPLDSTAVRSLIAAIDTTVGGTRVKARYALSAKRDSIRDKWDLSITLKDTTVHWMVRDSIIEKPIEVQVVPFWIEVVLIASLIALVIALLKK